MISEIYLIMCRNDYDANTEWAIDVNAFLNKENAEAEMSRMQESNPDLKFTLETISVVDQ